MTVCVMSPKPNSSIVRLKPPWPPRVNLDVLPVAAFETRRDQPLAAEARALAAGRFDVRDVLGMKPVIHRALRQQAVEQRRIDPLPATRHAPRTDGGQHADRRHETRAVTDMGMAEKDRAFATGTRLLDHDAKLRGDERVITRLVTPRTLAAVRRDRADDESRNTAHAACRDPAQGFRRARTRTTR